MSESYTKADLLKELAQAAHISRRRVDVVLETLALVAYREARQGFAVPGICRLDVVHRKARQVRNPQNNQLLLIAEHDALRVRPVKRAKDTIAPTPRALVQIVSEPAAAPAAAAEIPVVATEKPVASAETPALPQPAVTSPAANPVVQSETPESAPKPYAVVPPPTIPAPATPPPTPSTPAASAPAVVDAVEEGQFISFRCKNCSQEIEAPLEMVGAPNECPSCGENLIVPYTSEPGTIWYQERTTTPEKLPPSPSTIAAMKGRTIRIELPDDI